MKLALDFIQNKNFDDALKLYQAVYENAEKPKVKARAAHNIAMVYEVKGDIEKAIEWAQKAIDMGNKSTKYYLQVLTQRKADDAKAKEQLNELSK
jgi:tetratricopeptide (TPR) repeat protein